MNRREFVVAAAAVPFALRAGLALAAGPRVVLVTADTEARIAAVDIVSGRVVRTIPTLPGPRSIERLPGALAVVCHTAFGAVTILDGRSLRVRHALHDFIEPRYTAAHPDGRHAFVTDSGSSQVVAVDVLRGTTLGRAPVGGWARHVTLSPDAHTLWVGLGTEAEEIALVDVSQPERPRFLRRIRPPFRMHDVGFAPDGRRVWVTSGATRELAVYDAAARSVLFTLPADAPPQHVTFGDRVAYVTSGRDGTLRVHALADGRALRTTRVPVGSYNVQQGPGRVLTPQLDGGALSVLGPSGALLHEIHVAPSSHDACFVIM